MGTDAPPTDDGGITVGCKRRIAFTDGASGAGEVWVSDVDGTGLMNLSNSPSADDVSPTWSPTGLRLAFASNRMGNYDIYSVNVDGSGLVNLTNGNATDDVHPVWSPDGSRIAFVRVSAVSPFHGTVWIMNANGSGAVQVSTLPFYSDLAWSPQGNRLAFNFYDPTIAPMAKVPLIYVADVGTDSSLVKLTPQTKADEVSISWAPSTVIAFTEISNIFTANGDGSGLVNLTNGAGRDSLPHVIANGSKIVFSSDRNAGHVEIWIMNADGSNASRITSNNLTGGGDLLGDVAIDDSLVIYIHETSATAATVGVAALDGTAIHTFNAPGLNNARGVRVSGCP